MKPIENIDIQEFELQRPDNYYEAMDAADGVLADMLIKYFVSKIGVDNEGKV